jgi:hypothetical protein
VATCIFCEHPEAITKEHVFPQWMRPFLELESGEQGTQTRQIARRGQSLKQKRHRARPATQTVFAPAPSATTDG